MAEADVNLLDVDAIETYLKTKFIGKKIVLYKSTSSTNDIAAEYAKAGAVNNGLVVLAEEQSRGRGRRGHRWFGGAGRSVLCSVLLFDVGIPLELVSLGVSVGVAEAVSRVAGRPAGIKWPNDIFINGKKVGGILIERFGRGGNYIVGIGVNCNQSSEELGEQLQGIATSIDIESGLCCERDRLVGCLLQSVEKWILAAAKGADVVVRRWGQLSVLLGRRVKVEFDRKQFTGNCIGVDPVRGLILQLDRGGVRIFDAAQTSILAFGDF